MPSFGEELRRERELRRISLREIAETTKISKRHLEALERNDFADLPGGVFNRGFVRAYAQCIGIDPERMVTAYLMEQQAQGDGADAAAATAKPPRRGRAWVGLLIAALALGLAAAVALWRFPDRIPWRSSRRPAEPRASIAPASLELSLRVERPTSGWIDCDGRVDTLDGLAEGARLAYRCSQTLIVEAQDGGALHELLPDGGTRPLGIDGQPLREERRGPARVMEQER